MAVLKRSFINEREMVEMDELILKIIENSLVGGAFLFLLYQFTTKFTVSQERIVEGLAEMQKGQLEMSNTLSDVSHTLSNLDDRVRALEEKKGML
jgi:hypothetical protein